MPSLKKAILVIIRDEEPNVILGGQHDLVDISDALDVLFRIRSDNQIVMRDTFDINSPFHDSAENVIGIITDIYSHRGIGAWGGGEVFVYFSTQGDRVIADSSLTTLDFKNLFAWDNARL
ncbi:hypothetical protein P8452_55017 [Trifolium repens]|jgi:hypothetical protein|nr:hypothetical protein P8452_55017 [Trifolium repens]